MLLPLVRFCKAVQSEGIVLLKADGKHMILNLQKVGTRLRYKGKNTIKIMKLCSFLMKYALAMGANCCNKSLKMVYCISKGYINFVCMS